MSTTARLLIRVTLILAFSLAMISPAIAQQTGDSINDSSDPIEKEPTDYSDGQAVVAGSIVLESNANISTMPTVSEESAQPQDGWTIIMTEDAEGAFPADNGWNVFDSDSDSGEDYWGDVSCRAYNGAYSIWGAAQGDMTDCSTYDNDMLAWMIYGPFDLSSSAGNYVTEAKLDFTYWLDTEPDVDAFWWAASADGSYFTGNWTTGNSGGWSSQSLDLSDYIGDSDVWIAFILDTNSSENGYEGVYVDDIVLSKYVVDSLDPDIDVDPASMSFTRDASSSSAAVQASTLTSAEYAELQAKVEEDGQLPVIVQMQSDFAPEGTLNSPQAVAQQRDTIAQRQGTLLASLPAQGVGSVKQFESTPYMAMTVNSAALAGLQRSPFVADIIEDVAVPPSLDISVPLINADDAWVAGFSGAGQTVAVLDTGVDSGHPFLADKVMSEACYSMNSADSVSLCPGGSDSEVGSGTGANCDSSISGCWHGTHVAGIAAGNGDDGNVAAFDGVAPDADLIVIQVFARFDDDDDCDGSAPCALSYTSDQMAALQHVYDLRETYDIASVNMSLGGDFSETACDSDPRKAFIDNLRSANIATVIASGNSSYTTGISYPACISSAVSVGATTSHSPADEVASYSNTAGILDLLAPGSGINSSIPGDNYGSANGTSMATPHVAGAWAVLKSQGPDATVDDILYALKSTGVSITDSRNSLTFPRIDVHAALVAAANEDVLMIHNNGYSDLTVSGISVLDPTVNARGANAVECDWLVLNEPTMPVVIASGDSEPMGVSIDVCEGPGTYTKSIRIVSDDPDDGTVLVPVTLTVSGPLAVTISWFLAEQVDDMVEFQWEMATESGVSGFNILAEGENGNRTLLNDELIPSAAIDSLTPTRYEFSAETNGERFFLQEVGINGIVQVHGPFELSSPNQPMQPGGDDTAPVIWLPLFVQ